MSSNTCEDQLEAQKRETRTWQIVSIVLLVIGIALLIWGIYLYWKQKEPCDCLITKRMVQEATQAENVLNNYRSKIEEASKSAKITSPVNIKFAECEEKEYIIPKTCADEKCVLPPLGWATNGSTQQVSKANLTIPQYPSSQSSKPESSVQKPQPVSPTIKDYPTISSLQKTSSTSQSTVSK